MKNELIKQDLFGFIETDEDKKYTSKVNIPQYLPKNEKPPLWECFNLNKYNELIKHINSSSISSEEKEFLKFAATRHIEFMYARIADYYAHASKEMQELMEESALVIIDINDAIANGYVELSKSIEQIVKKSGIKPIENYPGRRKKNER